MASRPAESRGDQGIRLEEVEEFTDTHAKFVLVVGVVGLAVPCVGVVIVGLAGWLLGVGTERWPRDVLRFAGICGVVAVVAALLFLWGLGRRWIRRERVARFLGPLDVKLCGPVVVDRPFSVLVKQPVSRPVRIDRLDVSLVCVERTCGTEVSVDRRAWPFIDQRELYSRTHHFGLEDRLVPAGAAPEAVAEFELTDGTRTLLREQGLIARELFNKRSNDGDIRIDDRVIRWLIRVEVLVAGATVRRADFLMPFPPDGGLL